MTPSAVSLADGAVGRALEGHALLASKGHHRVQGGPGPLQPPVGQDPGGATIDFCTNREKDLDLSKLTDKLPGVLYIQPQQLTTHAPVKVS